MLDEDRTTNPHAGPPEVVILDRVRSISFMAALPAEEWAGVEHEPRGLIAEEFGGAGTVTVPYETAAYWVEKVG